MGRAWTVFYIPLKVYWKDSEMTVAMNDRLKDLLTSHYEIEVEEVGDAWWTATVTLVTETTTALVATFGGFTRATAYDGAVKFVKDRPR